MAPNIYLPGFPRAHDAPELQARTAINTASPDPTMTLPSFDLGYSDDDAATVISLDKTSSDPELEHHLHALEDSSPSPSPRVRSLSDISREPTPFEKSARISSWLAGLTPPRDLSALRRPSATRHVRFPGYNPPPRQTDISYLLSDSGSNADSITPRTSNATLPSDKNTPATSIYDAAPKAGPPPNHQLLERSKPLAATTTLTILGPTFAPRMPRPGTPEFALLFFALVACALVSPRVVFIFVFAYGWGRLSESAFCGAQREADEAEEDEGVRLGRRMARIMG